MVTVHRSPIEVVAHRGCGTAFTQPDAPPENSRLAVEAAWQAGADACEIDVHLTADGRVVVIHDETTERTADRSLIVRDTSLADLQKLDAGSWKGGQWSGVRISTLEEVLTTIPPGKRLLIELKTGPKIVLPLSRVLEAAGTDPNQLVVMSFDFETTAESKRRMPAIAHLFLAMFDFEPVASEWSVIWQATDPSTGNSRELRQQPVDVQALIERVQAAGLDGINVSHHQPEDLFLSMRDAGVEWSVWTVNDPLVAIAMAVKGVASITSDRPQLIARELHQHGFATAPRGPGIR
mgnify:CR=1 FL=1|jgi:glycerophosphoryl diester phosphodiesterase